MQNANQTYEMANFRDVFLGVAYEMAGGGAETNHTYRRSWQRSVAIAIVALIHIVVVATLAGGARRSIPLGSTPELQISLLSPNLGPPEALAPPLDWTFASPEDVLVPEPQITITPDQEAGEGIVAAGIIQKLAPRLDPSHLNEKPELPRTLGSMVGAIALKLRILVLPDGSVGDTQVVSSTGERDIDQLAVNWVRNSWHYLPASVNGKPMAAWTTIIVRFAAI